LASNILHITTCKNAAEIHLAKGQTRLQSGCSHSSRHQVGFDVLFRQAQESSQ